MGLKAGNQGCGAAASTVCILHYHCGLWVRYTGVLLLASVADIGGSSVVVDAGWMAGVMWRGSDVQRVYGHERRSGYVCLNIPE